MPEFDEYEVNDEALRKLIDPSYQQYSDTVSGYDDSTLMTIDDSVETTADDSSETDAWVTLTKVIITAVEVGGVYWWSHGGKEKYEEEIRPTLIEMKENVASKMGAVKEKLFGRFRKKKLETEEEEAAVLVEESSEAVVAQPCTPEPEVCETSIIEVEPISADADPVVITKEEAQKILFDAMLDICLGRKKLQELATAHIISENGEALDGMEVLKELPLQERLAHINRMLNEKPELLEQWQQERVEHRIGRALFEESRFIPIEDRELLLLKSDQDNG